MAGYALAKYRFRGRAAVQVFMLASLTIPTVALLAPSIVLVAAAWRWPAMLFLTLLILGAAGVTVNTVVREAPQAVYKEVAWDALLPPELRDSNPLGYDRLYDGKPERAA